MLLEYQKLAFAFSFSIDNFPVRNDYRSVHLSALRALFVLVLHISVGIPLFCAMNRNIVCHSQVSAWALFHDDRFQPGCRFFTLIVSDKEVCSLWPISFKLTQVLFLSIPNLTFLFISYTNHQTCQVDLVCDKGHKYFLSVLQDSTIGHEYRTMAAFILASIVHNFPMGQSNSLQGSMVSICLVHICDPNSMLRQWLAICLGNLWQNYDKARWSGVRDLAHEKLYPLLQDPVPDVRAAAVYALGTFISSVTNNKDRTEHANNIDRSIAMTMLTAVGNDMSPVVRMELISALQWMVILFECQFVSVFLQEPTMGIGNLPAAAVASIHLPHHPPLPPHHHHHQQHHTHSLERNINIKRVSSSSSIVNMNGSGSLINFHSGTTTLIGFGSIYMKLWQGLIQLCRDPYPEVAQMATKVIDFIVNQAVDLISAKEATKENFGNLVGIAGTSSQSLPPSPNTRTSYLGESPPMHHGLTSGGGGVKQLTSTVKTSTMSTAATSNDPLYNLHNRTRSRSSTPTSTGAAVPPVSQPTTNRSRRNSKNQGTIDDSGGGDASDDNHHFDGQSTSVAGTVASHQQSPSPLPLTSKSGNNANQMTSSINSNSGAADYQQKAIVATAFLHWSVGQFSSAATLKTKRYDCHAPEELERIVRYQRNHEIRRIGREQQLRSANQRLETQFWVGRTQFQPHIVKLHPYEPQIAVAYKNKIMVSDWQRINIQSYVPQPIQLATKSPPFHSIVSHMVMHGNGGPQSRVTAVEFINAHDKTIILAGYEDGSVRIWRPPPTDGMVKESKLVTAWQAIGDVTRSKYQSNATNATSSGNGGGIGGSASTSPATDLCIVWQQRSQSCAIAGDPSYIRCWNVETELKTADIRTGSDSSIVTLTTAPNEILAAGFADGSVRLYDKRLPTADAKIMTFRESSTAILAVCLRDDCERLITGW